MKNPTKNRQDNQSPGLANIIWSQITERLQGLAKTVPKYSDLYNVMTKHGCYVSTT